MKAVDYFNSGIEKQNKTDYEGAISDYTTAIFLDSSQERKTLTNKNEDGSIEQIDVIELNEGSVSFYFNRGSCYIRLGKYLQAVEDFTHIIDYTPNDAEAYFKRAIANYCLENDLEVRIDLGIAYELDPKFSEEEFYKIFQ